MGKASTSSVKSKEAREARKIEQRRLADCTRLIAAANKLAAIELDVLCGDLRQYRLDDLEVQISCSRVNGLSSGLLDWAIDLTRRNMQKLYEDCAWGWNIRKKTEEMSEEEALYAVVRAVDGGTPLAFSHFRFDMDHGTPVVYCYELQVEEEWRGRGLGARLLALLERLARDTGMKCVRLTVLRHNPRATAFFTSCGYTLDETSPDVLEAAHYQILSKYVEIAPDTKLASSLTACTLSS